MQQSTLFVGRALEGLRPRDLIRAVGVPHAPGLVPQLDEELAERRLDHDGVRQLCFQVEGTELRVAEYDLSGVGFLLRLPWAESCPPWVEHLRERLRVE